MKTTSNARLALLTAAALSAVLLAPAWAANITYVGSVDGAQVANWRDSAIAKSMDIDGDNVYGSSLGAVNWTWGALGIVGSPATSFGWSYQGGGSQSRAAALVNTIPDTTPRTTQLAGISPNNFIFWLHGSTGAYQNRTVRIGIMDDCLDPISALNDSGKTLQLTGLYGGDSGVITVRGGAAGDGIPDMHFFDITDANPFDEFTITAGGTGSQASYIGPVSWDITPIISYVGTETAVPTNSYAAAEWSLPAVPKTYDLRGTERYGTAGYYQIRPNPNYSETTGYGEAVTGAHDMGIALPTLPTLHSKPAFVNALWGYDGSLVNYPGYSIYRDDAGSGLVRQGALSVQLTTEAQSPYGLGTYAQAIAFTLSEGGSFRLGLSTDSLGGGASTNFSADFISVWCARSGTVYSRPVTRDGNPDIQFFDINGNAGEEFRVALWRIGGGFNTTWSPVTLSLITFDKILPPSYYSVGSGTWSAGFDPALFNGVETIYNGAGGAAENNHPSETINSISLIKFDSIAGAYTLTAQSGAAGESSASPLAISGDIINNSPNTQSINMALSFSSVRIINAASGALNIGGDIANAGSLTFTGPSNIVVSGAVIGAGSVTKSGAGTASLLGANAYTGNTTVNQGILHIAQSTLAASSTIAVASGAKLDLGFSYTNQVSSLVLNGEIKAPGVYNSINSAPYITGSGSLLVAVPAPTPANITYSVVGNDLVLNWPTGQGWQLQVQTNSPGGLSANWAAIPGATPPYTNNINDAAGSVFYRLMFQ